MNIEDLQPDRDALGEDNDCAVTAFAVARGMSYQRSHALHAKVGRKNGQPIYRPTCLDLWKRYGLVISYVHLLFSLADMLSDERYQKGSFVAWVPNHVFAIVDGIPQDKMLKECREEIDIKTIYIEAVGYFT